MEVLKLNSTGRATPAIFPSPDTNTFARFSAFLLAHPVASAFLFALSVRIIVATAINILFDGSLFLDDLTYHQMASDLAADLHTQWDPYTQFLFNTTASFLGPLAVLYEVFGPHIIVGQLFVAVMGAGVAALVTLYVFDLTGRKELALVGGLVIGFLPSQVLWSSLVLKDAEVWLLLAALAVVVQRAQKVTRGPLLLMLAGSAGLLVALGFLRPHTMVVAALGTVTALGLSQRAGRGERATGGLLIAVLVPWITGYGLLGTTLIFNEQSLHERRINNAVGAATAFVEPTPSDGDPPSERASRPAGTQRAPLEDTGTLEADIAHLPRGLAHILLAPFPWEEGSSSTGVTLARFESLLWYPLLALGLVGAVLSLRLRLRTALLFPLLSGSGSVFVYALTEGNVGTAYRHRGEFVWAVVVFAIVALRHLWQTGISEQEYEVPVDEEQRGASG